MCDTAKKAYKACLRTSQTTFVLRVPRYAYTESNVMPFQFDKFSDRLLVVVLGTDSSKCLHRHQDSSHSEKWLWTALHKPHNMRVEVGLLAWKHLVFCLNIHLEVMVGFLWDQYIKRIVHPTPAYNRQVEFPTKSNRMGEVPSADEQQFG